MLVPKPRFHRLAQDAIDQLAKDGITCTPDEILWLQEMADDVVKSVVSDPSRFLDFPTPCGNVLLWPLSIGAKQWFKSVATWFEFDNQIYTLAQAYIMVHGREPDFLISINTRALALWKILLWSRHITCSLAELNRTMDDITTREDWVDIKTPKEEAEENNGSPRAVVRADWGEILARLMHFYPGHALSYWLWKISDDVVATLLDRTNTFLPIEQRLFREDKNFQKFSRMRLVIKSIRENRNLSAVSKSQESGGNVNDCNRPEVAGGRIPNGDCGNQTKKPE